MMGVYYFIGCAEHKKCAGLHENGPRLVEFANEHRQCGLVLINDHMDSIDADGNELFVEVA